MGDLSGGRCQVCGKSTLVAQNLATCADCIRDHPQRVMAHIRELQEASRREFDLPLAPPRDSEGVACRLCVNECLIPEGAKGFCGLRTNQRGRLVHLAGSAAGGILHWYHDPLSTNCVAAWVCQGKEQHGYNNLAVSYGACTFHCLYCQNWQYRNMSAEGEAISAE